jgi:hypothetical protein
MEKCEFLLERIHQEGHEGHADSLDEAGMGNGIDLEQGVNVRSEVWLGTQRNLFPGGRR